MASTIKVTLVRSPIKRPETQRRVLEALGLRKLHHSVVVPDRPSVRGMIYKVSHLVRVERVRTHQEGTAR